MSRIETKVTLLSRQLDLLQNLCNSLRTDKRVPIEVKGDIVVVMLKVRELEKKSDMGLRA
jgi:hypothetical protein